MLCVNMEKSNKRDVKAEVEKKILFKCILVENTTRNIKIVIIGV